MEIEGLNKKEFVITIEWVMNAKQLLTEGTIEELDILRESGSAEITDIKLRDKEVKG